MGRSLTSVSQKRYLLHRHRSVSPMAVEKSLVVAEGKVKVEKLLGKNQKFIM